MTTPRFASARRAAPRLLVTVLLLMVAVGAGALWLQVVAVVGLAFSLPGRRWWHYVRTGEALQDPVGDRFSEPGPYEVELLDVGPHHLDVIRALREVRGLTLLEAKQLTESLPATVADHLSQSSAQAVAGRIAAAGGRARVPVPGPSS